MSEHIVALALAAAKRLFIEHANLKRGEFNQRSANWMLRGGVCGILGFGNVGVATARLMRAFGMKIHAINRRGASDEPMSTASVRAACRSRSTLRCESSTMPAWRSSTSTRSS